MKIYRFLWLLLLAVSSFAQTHTEVTLEDAQVNPGVTGAKTFAKINNVIMVDGTTYTGAQALQSAIQACSAFSTSCVVDARNPNIGTQTFTVDPFANLNIGVALDTGAYTIQWDHHVLNVNLPSHSHWIMHGTYVLNSSGSTGASITPGSGALDNSVLEQDPFLGTKVYTTTGSITTATKTLTVANGTGFTVGAMVGILGANGSSSAQATTINQGGGIGTGDTSFIVASTAGWYTPNNNYLKIDNEIIKCSGGTATTFSSCVRAQLGTSAATHANLVAVQAVPLFLSEVLKVSGTTITIQDAATLTVSSAPVFTGVSDVTIEGSGTLDGNQTLASPITNLMGIMIVFSGNVTIGPGIKVKNFDQAGVQITCAKHNSVINIEASGIGKPPQEFGWDVGLFEMASENYISTASSSQGTDSVGGLVGDIGLFIDDRSTDFTYCSGQSNDNEVHLGPIKNYTDGVIIQSGSNRNTVYASNITIATGGSRGITFNADADWSGTASQIPHNNHVFFGSINAPALAIDNFNVTAGVNTITGGIVIGGAVNDTTATSNDTVIWQDSTGNWTFSGQMNGKGNGAVSINEISMRRSGGGNTFPDIIGDGTNALVLGGKGDGSGTVKFGNTTTVQFGGAISGNAGGAISANNIGFTRSGGAAGFPDIIGDGTHALVVGDANGVKLEHVVSDAGLEIFNTTTTCTTAASVGATCTTAAITLPVAEADTSYRAACTGKGLTNVPVVIATTNSSATQFTITIAALTAAAASFTSYDCVVGHN